MPAAVRALRGATTVDEDTVEQVNERTQALVRQMLERNGVDHDDLISIPRLIEASKGGRFDREAKLTELFGIRLGRLNFDTATSQPGSMRGKSVGFIPWDECLTQKDWEMWAALAPTQASQRSPQMFMTSTAGDLESVLLRKFYDDLVRQSNGHDAPDPTFYGAWWQSEDPDAGLDWQQIAQANPGIDDDRPNRAFIEHEYRTAPPEIWRRERLNHWQDTIASSAFGPGQWDAAHIADPVPDHAPMYNMGVSVGPDWERATIAIAAMRDDQRIGVAVYKDMRAAPGDALTAADVIREVHDFGGFATMIAFESNSAGAPAFRRDRDENGWQWHELTPSGVTAACMDMTEMVQGGLLAVDDPLLDAQVSMAGRKPVGLEGAFRFARSASTGPIDALLAATFAAHCARFSSDIGVYIPA